MPDLFQSITEEPDPIDVNPHGITEGDVVEIPSQNTKTRTRTGFVRRIYGASAWVESDVNTVTGWYSLVCLKHP